MAPISTIRASSFKTSFLDGSSKIPPIERNRALKPGWLYPLRVLYRLLKWLLYVFPSTHLASIDTLIVRIRGLWARRSLVKIRSVAHVVRHLILAEIEGQYLAPT
jgi:hypothetical protein